MREADMWLRRGRAADAPCGRRRAAVFPDLQQEESVLQFVDTIAFLSKATNSVFDRLSARVRACMPCHAMHTRGKGATHVGAWMAA
jgi:hypothetical protein